MSVLIKNAWVITFANNGLGIIEDGAILSEDGKITFVGKTADLVHTEVETVIDVKNHVVLPGFINAHTHTGITLLRGAAQDVPEIEWMNKAIGPLSMHLKPQDALLGSKLGLIEGIRTGTTTFGEYAYNVADLMTEVHLPFNVRVFATETINEISANRGQLKPSDLYEFDRTKGEKAFHKAEELFGKYDNHPLVSCAYGPQALDMISLDLLQSIQSQAIEHGRKVHMHVAQGQRERLQIQGRYGKEESTVKVLKANNLLGEHLLAAHCHDTDEKEKETLVENKTSVVCCPSSIAMIDGVVPPVYPLKQLGGNVALGTDQAPGPGTHNMVREMRTISIVSKVVYKDPTILPAWETLKLATIEGAKAIGLEKSIGSIEVGKQADIITIDLKKSNLTPIISRPFKNFIPNLVYSATGFEVDNVMVNGKLILHNNHFTTINEDAIIEEANKRTNEICLEAEEDWVKADSLFVKKVKEGLL